MLNTAFSSWPSYTEQEAEILRHVLLSNRVNYWTGSECKDFEKEFAAWVGVEYAIALSNGTVALEAALKAIAVQSGDEVIITSRSFIASASSIVNVGANPVFCDVDENSQNITANTIRKVLTPRTKAIICVHLAGWPCEMDEIMALANEYNLYVIEDCAQAHGAQYKGRSVGSIGHIGAWSFCQDKIMTTGGEGGMITTNHHGFWSFMWSFKEHGKSYEAVQTPASPTEFKWVHESFGTNGRMLEMQAALGRYQLKKMAEWHRQRLENAKTIWQAASQIKGLRVPVLPNHIEHAAYRCYVFVEPEKLVDGWTRARILEEINSRGVPCYYGSCSEMYLEKAFDNTSWRPANRLPSAKKLGETSLVFLVHPTLKPHEIEKTSNILRGVMLEATESR